VTALAALALRLYAFLARAFPVEFRRAHHPELLRTTEDLIRDEAQRRGVAGVVPLLVRILVDLCARILVEHVAELTHDIRYGARLLARSRGFTLSSVVCLGIGIGLSVSIYCQMDSIVFRPLPAVRDPASLVRLEAPVAYSNYEAYRDDSGQFAALAAYVAPVPFLLASHAQTERIWGQLVTPDYFRVLGTAVAAGRAFGAEEHRPDCPPVAVISYRLWQARLGSDHGVIDRVLRINGHPVTVIGIAPRGFLGASPVMAAADIWIPTTVPPGIAPELGPGALRDRGFPSFQLVGRLKPRIDTKQAEAALDAIARRLEQLHNDPGKDRMGRRARLLPGGNLIPMARENLPVAIAFPVVIAGLTLLIACMNVATMLLVRGAARRREIAVRLAIGASRGRIIRQLLTEDLMLAALGGAAGVAFALWLNTGSDAARPILPGYMDFSVQFGVRAAAVAVLLALATALLFGVAPALHATRSDITEGLRAGTAPGGRRHRWFNLRNILVLQEVAGSLMLLLVTGFIVLGFSRSSGVDLGFEPHNLYVLSLDPVRDGYTAEQAARFFAGLPDRARGVAGVVAATLSQSSGPGVAPVEMTSASVLEPGRPPSIHRIAIGRVGADFFETVGIPILEGRSFSDADEREDARVMLVNRTMARELWPGNDAVGQRVELLRKTYEIVGVAGDVRSGFILGRPQPAAYLPILPSQFARPSIDGVTLLVRTQPGVDATPELRRRIASSDPNVTVFSAGSMFDQVRQMLYIVRVSAAIYGGIGLFGLLLAVVGLAGVTAYAVARRTHEIGIRMALGATSLDTLKLVLKEGAVLVVLGTLLGHGAALGTMKALGSMLEAFAQTTQTSTSDPVLLVGAPLILAGLAMLACYLPARKSTRIDPAGALRAE